MHRRGIAIGTIRNMPLRNAVVHHLDGHAGARKADFIEPRGVAARGCTSDPSELDQARHRHAGPLAHQLRRDPGLDPDDVVGAAKVLRVWGTASTTQNSNLSRLDSSRADGQSRPISARVAAWASLCAT